jgi:hypothetical protein
LQGNSPFGDAGIQKFKDRGAAFVPNNNMYGRRAGAVRIFRGLLPARYGIWGAGCAGEDFLTLFYRKMKTCFRIFC